MPYSYRDILDSIFRILFNQYCSNVPALLLRRCLQLTPASLASCSLISILFILVGVLLRERLEGFVNCREDLWLVVFKSSFSREGDDTLDKDDAE